MTPSPNPHGTNAEKVMSEACPALLWLRNKEKIRRNQIWQVGCMAICGIHATMYCASGRLPFDNGGRVFFMKREGKPRLTESKAACRCSAEGLGENHLHNR
jgi:hypothetical protein